jgi:hypothetical protein
MRSSFNPDHILFDVRAKKIGERRFSQKVYVPFENRFQEIRKPYEVLKGFLSGQEFYEHIDIALPCLLTPGERAEYAYPFHPIVRMDCWESLSEAPDDRTFMSMRRNLDWHMFPINQVLSDNGK